MHLDLIVPLVMLKVFIMIKYFISFQFWQFLLLEVIFEQVWFRISKMENNVQHYPGIEPGSRRWESGTLPMSHNPNRCRWSWVVLSCWLAGCLLSNQLFTTSSSSTAECQCWDWTTGSLPVNNSIPLMITYSCWGCGSLVKHSTLVGVSRVRNRNDAGHCENYFPFWKFWTKLDKISLQEAKSATN